MKGSDRVSVLQGNHTFSTVHSLTVVSPVLLQTLLKSLHATHAAMFGAGQEPDPPAPPVLVRQQRREQDGQAPRQLTEVVSAFRDQLT